MKYIRIQSTYSENRDTVNAVHTRSAVKEKHEFRLFRRGFLDYQDFPQFNLLPPSNLPPLYP